MICWFCSRPLGASDIKRKKECVEPNEIKQTEYLCINCGSLYVVSERKVHGPTVEKFNKNVPSA